MALVGGIVAGGVLDIAGGLIGGAMDRKAREDQEDFIKNHLLGRRFQYAVEDLYKAGLNPALAYSNPASAPAPGQISPGRYISDAASAIGSSVRDYQAKKAAISVAEQQAKNTAADTTVKAHQSVNLDADTNKKTAEKVQAEQATRESKAREIREITTAKEAATRTELMRADLPGRQAEGDIDRSAYGRGVRALMRLNPFAHSAAALGAGK